MATTTLVCKQCNFENEPERVYCHNCGAKLDRSLLPPEASKRSDPVVVQERVRKMVSPRRGMGLRWLRNLFLSVLIAAVLGLVIVMLRPPDDIPEVTKEAAMDAPAITDDMEAMTSQSAATSKGYREQDVNAFLQSTIHGKPASSSGVSPLKFERAYVHFDEGVVRITYVQSIFGFPLYATTADTVAIQGGQVVAKPVAGSLGRVKLPAQVMPALGNLFAPLWKVLERDKNLVAKMDSITFHKGQVIMASRASGR